jgi:Protein of unknown function (DUF2563)
MVRYRLTHRPRPSSLHVSARPPRGNYPVVADLQMHPERLAAFAAAVDAQVRALAPNVRRSRVAPGVFGDFDAAHALTEQLNSQLGAVHERLDASVRILHTIGRAAALAAELTAQSDEAAAASMQRVRSLIGSAERRLGRPGEEA